MKARLDHIGIAVNDLQAALAFYRDALGLHVEPPEEIPSEHVRAHFVPVGGPALELLEATSPESAIARHLEKRGPGIHHITLRIDDIHAAVAQMQVKGIRLLGDAPRPGAEGSLIAFVHPASTHGVLVELKQSAVAIERFRTPVRHLFADLELITLSDGFFHLDGGAMFGVVPRTLWEQRLPPDDRNRITLGMRPLIVRGERTLLIDAGCGDKFDAKSAHLYGVERDYHLDHSLHEAGLTVDDIDLVLASHLHFDHIGGFTTRAANGRVVPRFPRARYIAHRGEWEDAMHPHERNRASYLPENFVPLAEAGVLDLVDDDAAIMPGVRLRRSGGHTTHHQVVMIESRGRTAVFTADMIPTASHVPDAWIMGYDLYPMDTLAFKRAFIREAIEREYLIFFEHEPSLAAGMIREQGGKRTVERII